MSLQLMNDLSLLGLRIHGTQDSWCVMDETERYRYAMGRSWDPLLSDGRVVLWILHNPSIATHDVDDPTLRKAIGFSRIYGFSSLIFCNVMAWRSTDKAALLGLDDPVGPSNAAALEYCIGAADLVIAAWGGIDPKLGVKPRRLVGEGPMECLGKTREGAPRHPLYLPYETPLEAWP